MQLLRALLLAISFFNTGVAHAYLPYSQNANLMEEMASQPYRILPRNSFYALAVDADFFKPLVFNNVLSDNYYRYDFYHGNGYWMDVRGEFKPTENITLNTKFSVTHGTSSNGPTYLATIVPWVGLTYREKLFGFDFTARLSDIGRQTIGTGLFIEQKETDGGYFLAKKDDFSLKIMVDGTGSYRIDGGVVAVDVSKFDGLVGVTAFLQESGSPFDPPSFISTVYSKQMWEGKYGYGVEGAIDQNAKAAMAYLEYKDQWFHHLNLWVKPQFRYYGKSILGSLPGKVAHTYIGYDQNDKPFTSLMNIFAFGDNVTTYSAQVNLEYVFNPSWRVYTETEVVNYQYVSRSRFREIFYRIGTKFYPFKDRDEHFGILIGNKYLIASTLDSSGQRTYSSPTLPDFENKPLFMNQLYAMFNFETRF